MDQIRNESNKDRKNTLTLQELKTKKHLEDMFALVSKMTSNGRKINKNDSRIKQIREMGQREF